MGQPKAQEVYVSPYDAGTLHAEVRAEVDRLRMEAHPWSRIRPLQEGVDDPSGHACDGSQGNHHLDCPKKVEAVQYNCQGEPQWYCEEHALLQNEWDICHYWSKPKPHPDPGPEWQAEVDAVMKKLFKPKRKREEPEEMDPS